MADRTPAERARSIELLRSVINASGMPIKRWAQLVAWRDESTVHRWLNGDSPIPALVRENLQAIAMRLGAS